MWTPEVHPNQFVAALRTFTLTAPPRRATLRLFADTKYKLYINGQFVNAGPAHFRKPVVSVDAHDVASYLNKGRNTILIVAHFVGSTVKYNAVDKPGILVDLTTNSGRGQDAGIVSDAQWRVAGLECWNQATPRRNWAMEHVEDLNLTHPSFLILARYAAGDYAAGPAQNEPAGLWQKPALHDRPDLELRERQVAPLQWTREDAPLPVIFRTNTEVYNLPDTAVRLDHEYTKPAWDETAYEMTRSGCVRFDRREGEPGFALCYDFRHMCAGDPAAEIVCAAPCTLDFALAEAARSDGHPIVWRNGTLHYARFHLAAGVNRVRFYHSNGHRYLYLVLKDVVGPVEIRSVTAHQGRASLDFSDTLTCNDRTAESLYRISRNSLMLNTQSVLCDCNTREQGAYWGDSLWVSDSVGHQTGDFRHMRNLCITMTDEVRANGPVLPGCMYGLGEPLFDFGLIPVEILHRYHSFTGDLAIARAHLPTAQTIVRAYETFRDPNGLLAVRNLKAGSGIEKNGLLFLDHPGNTWHPMTTVGIDRRDYSAGLNLLYLQALQALDALERACGQRSHRSREIATLTHTIRSLFFIEEHGLLADSSPLAAGEPHRFSQIANALGITTGVLEGAQARHALEQVMDIPRHPWISQGTPYSYYFLADAAARTGLGDEAVRVFCRDFTPMLERGATTTWEAWNADNHDSLNHAWSAPLPWLIRNAIMGLRALRPGYGESSLTPQVKAFDQMEARCCIPQGVVEMAWTRETPDSWRLKAVAPKGVSCTLNLPRGKRRFEGTWVGLVRV